MELDLNVLRPQERASLQLRLLYEQEGFRKYHMGRFEEYGLYQMCIRDSGSGAHLLRPGENCGDGPGRGSGGPVRPGPVSYTHLHYKTGSGKTQEENGVPERGTPFFRNSPHLPGSPPEPAAARAS